MNLPPGCTIAIVDGETLKLFLNEGDERQPKLTSIRHEDIDAEHKGSGGRHHSSSANPDDQQIDEDGFASGAARLLNTQVATGKIGKLIIVAAPRTLGEMRKYLAKKTSEHLLGEVSKELTNSSIKDIEKALFAA